LNNRAFFFKGDSLLLPENSGDSDIDKGVPPELSNDFKNPDIFEIPALNPSEPAIKTIYVNELPQNWRTIPVRQFLVMAANGSLRTDEIIRACHIAQWRQTSVFCGRCGEKNIDVPNEVQRLCPKCANIEFPRICPAVIVAITEDENRILLAHNRKFRAGVYSLIAGFNEAGESLEETAAREIREEVNIEVKDVAYVKSQCWPFPNSLMLGFSARHSSGEIKPDGVEIEDAKWFTKDNLPDIPAEGSLSRYLIKRWQKGTLYDIQENPIFLCGESR
jgi:NAD+ diphosphatase